MADQEVHETCREWVEKKNNRCNEPAVMILWGKLFDPDAMGPRCLEHGERWLREQGAWSFPDALRQHYAIFDLRNLRRTK
jgi:hypothetical protein